MKKICIPAVVAAVAFCVSVSFAADLPKVNASAPKLSVGTSVQAKAGSAVISNPKNNWSKIKDLFL